MHQATFLRKQAIGPDIWEFFFEMSEPLDYQPGQYVQVTLPGIHDARGPQRAFTLTSLPGDTDLSFAVKFPHPHSAYKSALLELQPRDGVTISQAMGDLVLPRDPRRPLVFVASGLGIASFVSIMKQLSREASPRSITLLYGHKPSERLYSSIINGCLGLELVEFISPNHMGIDDIISGPDTLYFVSGGESFTMGFRDALLAASIPATNIAYDYFDGYKGADL